MYHGGVWQGPDTRCGLWGKLEYTCLLNTIYFLSSIHLLIYIYHILSIYL